MDIIKCKKVTSLDIDMPKRKSKGAAGFDLQSTQSLVITNNDCRIIKCGYAFEIPINLVGLIKDRSSLAKNGIYVSGGVIDPDYRGEVKVMLRNESSFDREIKVGDRIAQIVFLFAYCEDLMQVDGLSETERGDGGFGSTGK